MADACPAEESRERRRELLNKLKEIVNKIGEEETCVAQTCRPSSPDPCCTPSCPPPTPEEPPKMEDQICKPPEIMICYKVKKEKPTKGAEKEKKPNEKLKVKQCKSRELRAGFLYIGCDCEKLNGLQDDCRRSDCQGSPECLAKPKPICCPSQYSNGKHLGRKGRKGTGAGGGSDGSDKDGGDEYCCVAAVVADGSAVCPCSSK